jgi:hypothetical protein
MSRRHLAITLSLALSTLASPSQADEVAQLMEQQKSGQQDLLVKPQESGTPLSPPKVGQAVDTTGIWYHLRRHDAVAAEKELARLQSENPGWNPPEAVEKALESEKQRTAMDRYLNSLPPASREVETERQRRQSGTTTGRQRPNDVEIKRIFEELRDPSLSADRLAAIAAKKDEIPGLKSSLADAYLNHALVAASRGAEFDELSGDAEKAIALGHADVWLTLGWRLLDGGQAATAVKAFQAAGSSEAAIHGRVLALRAAGQLESAGNLACEQRRQSSRLTELCEDSLAERQLATYQSGDYRTSMVLGERLTQIDPERRSARTLLAWSAYRDADWQRAAQLFSGLYDEAPDGDLAQGLMESLRQSGNQAEIDVRIARGDSRFRDMVALETAATAFDRKQFDLVASLPGAPSSLTGRPAWSATSGFEVSDTTGNKGLGRLTIIAARQSAEGMVGDVRVGITAVATNLNTGRPMPWSSMGALPYSVNSAIRPFVDLGDPTSAADVWQPVISLRRESPDWTITSRLSTTPLSGALESRPTGDFAVTHYMDPVIVTGKLFSDDVAGSMLSFNGLRDPLTSQYWGRVTDNGAGLQAIFLPVDRVSLSFAAESAYLDGIKVASNERVSLRTDAAYDFRPNGFDHLRSGPFVSWAHFDKNLSNYTFGQGGYYSPDSDQRLGILVDALTQEGQTWQIEAKTSAAYGQALEAASPRFPVTPNIGNLCGSNAASPFGSSPPTAVTSNIASTLENTPCSFKSSSSSGLDTDLSLRASALLAEQLILSGFARYSSAPSYTDVSFGAFITIPFETRTGVFSADLPDSQFNPFR